MRNVRDTGVGREPSNLHDRCAEPKQTETRLSAAPQSRRGTDTITSAAKKQTADKANV